ncbi:MAG: hypothetical protein GXO75_03760 [Calditrichaeota bacterium]|nr:hypothetical protein [Calditrichota bacterium]
MRSLFVSYYVNINLDVAKLRNPKQVKNRDRQFKNISKIEAKDIADAVNPIISMDTKKKKWVAEPGQFQVLIGSSSRHVRLQGGFALY